MGTYSTAVVYWSGLNPKCLSIIIEAPQGHDRAVKRGIPSLKWGLSCWLQIGIARDTTNAVPRRGRGLSRELLGGA